MRTKPMDLPHKIYCRKVNEMRLISFIFLFLTGSPSPFPAHTNLIAVVNLHIYFPLILCFTFYYVFVALNSLLTLCIIEYQISESKTKILIQ